MNLTTRITMGLAVCCFPAGLLLLCGTESRALSRSKRPNSHAAVPAAGKAQLAEAYGKLPLYFERNQGQTDSRVKFLSHGGGYTLFLTPHEAVLALRKAASQPSLSHQYARSDPSAGPQAALLSSGPEPGKDNGMILRMKLIGANRHAQVIGQNELPGKANYFIGNDPKNWHTNVPTYTRVKYDGVYPGVDLLYYGNQRQLENDFIVAPGADPCSITIGFDGAEKVSLDAQGDLVLATKGREVRFQKPVVYQEVGGVRREISGGYALKNAHEVGFEVGPYDASRPLVIDPVLLYSTYLGGSGDDGGFAITVDGAGNAYVTGCTGSANFPTTAGAFQSTVHNSGCFNTVFFGGDAFVTKLNPTGSGLVYSTYLGGSSEDVGLGIAVDAGGNAYIAGRTNSDDFPTTPGAYKTSIVRAGGCSSVCPCFDAFVTKLNPSGSALVYSTFLGGSGTDYALGIAIDSSGDAYVGGLTQSVDFPTTPGALQPTVTGVTGASCGPNAGFVTKINSTGSALVYSTYLGNGGGGVNSVAVDSSGDAYIAGSTSTTNFPTTPGAFQTTNGGGSDATVSKLNPTGTSLRYSTYLGGSGDDTGFGIAIDNIGDAYITGRTNSSNFPTTPGAFQTTFGGSYDAFVTKVNPLGTGLVYSTYLGGNGQDQGQGIAVDPSGNAYVAGFTNSTNFPTANPVQAANGGAGDAFVTKVNPTGTGLDYSTYLGGSGSDNATGIALDNLPNPNAYVAGQTASVNFPTTSGAFQTTFGGGSFDAFVTKIANIVLPPGPTVGKVTGGGTVNVSGGIANFGFIVQSQSTSGPISGDLQYVNHASGAKVHSVMFTTFTISGNTATFSGTCTNNGAPCTFNVTVQDNDQPPGTDSFVISINGGTPEGGTLRDGDIQIH